MNSLYDRLLVIDEDKKSIIDKHSLQVTNVLGESLDVVDKLSQQIMTTLSFEKNAIESFAKTSQLPGFQEVIKGNLTVYAFREQIMKLPEPKMERLYKRFAGQSYHKTTHLEFLQEKINEVYRFKNQSL